MTHNMAGKHTNSVEISDFERLRKENRVLGEELSQLRDEISVERETHEQLLQRFQASHNDDTRKLREEKKLTLKLAEENGELRLELKEARKRSSSRDDEKLAEADLRARSLMELTALGHRLGKLHADLLSSPLAKIFRGQQSATHGEIGIFNLVDTLLRSIYDISLDVLVRISYFRYLKALPCRYKGEDYGGLKLRKNVQVYISELKKRDSVACFVETLFL